MINYIINSIYQSTSCFSKTVTIKGINPHPFLFTEEKTVVYRCVFHVASLTANASRGSSTEVDHHFRQQKAEETTGRSRPNDEVDQFAPGVKRGIPHNCKMPKTISGSFSSSSYPDGMTLQTDAERDHESSLNVHELQTLAPASWNHPHWTRWSGTILCFFTYSHNHHPTPNCILLMIYFFDGCYQLNAYGFCWA